MSRPLRIEFPGALYHVMARGNAREAIFQDNDNNRTRGACDSQNLGIVRHRSWHRTAKRATRVPSEAPRQQRTHKSLAQYERETYSRNAAIEAAYASGTYTLKAIGEHFGLHYATVSRIA